MAGLGRPLSGWAFAALSWGCVVAAATPALAQNFRMPFPQQGELTPEQSLLKRLPRESQILTDITLARELLTTGDYDAGIDALQPLLEMGEDFFDIEQNKPAGSALDKIESLLRAMPPEAIEAYRRRYEPLATQRLTEAVSRGNLALLLEIVRTYPLTLAAASATQAAGEIAFDQGETALAARLWERLLLTTPSGKQRTTLLIEIARAWTLAGQPEVAAAYVRELSSLAQLSPIEYDGKLLAPPATGDVAWLNKVFGPVAPLVPSRASDWKVSGGHVRRWGTGPQVSSLQRGHWAYPLVDEYDVYEYNEGVDQPEPRYRKFQALLRSLEQKYLANKATKNTPVVIGSPLVDGETVLVQGPGSVKAIDVRTGQLRWTGVVVDSTFLYFAERHFEELNLDQPQGRLVEIFLGQRTWLNQTAASLASDGKQVYSVSSNGLVGLSPPRNMFMQNKGQPPRHELTPPSENRLLAYDIQSGLLKWEAGGPSVALPRDEDDQLTGESRSLAGAFFLGAALPVDGQLFVLAEDHGQIRIFSLSPKSGEVEWSLPLMNPDSGIAFDETRRMYGLSPSYAGGLLICPTGEGIVVAIDPLRRRVVWVQQYQPRTVVLNDRMMAMMRFQRARMGNESRLENMVRERRWFDATPVLTAGRVLLPAPESNQLYCLDLESGKQLWSLARDEGLFLAACTERHCLITGEHSIQAVSLKDGKEAWSQIIPTPAGRGVVSGGKYLLPVSTNEILSIDMKSGRILARSGVDPAHHAGSLVAAGDRLMMQTASQIIGLRPLSEMSTEIAHDLLDTNTRARALAEQGELLLFQGREKEAISLLQESLQLQESIPTRRLLVWSQLDRLKSDYQGSRSIVAELKKTVLDPDQKKLLNRLDAEGLEKAGESLNAFQAYLELVRDISWDDELIEVTFDHRVREDRWLCGRLTHLYTLADETLRQQMRSSINQAVATHDNPVKTQFATVLGMTLAPELHLELALANSFDPFKSQRVLWTLSESADLKLRGPAVARLINKELSQARTLYIGHLIQELKHELASVECEPGVTGSAFLERLQLLPRFGAKLKVIEERGSLPQVAAKQNGPSMAIRPRKVFPTLGAQRGPYTDWMFNFEENPAQQIQLSDGSGRNQDPPLTLEAHSERRSRDLRYVQSDPQLVLLAFRNQFVVINPMEPGHPLKLMASFSNQPQVEDRVQNLPEKNGVRDTLYPTANNSYLGNVGPLAYDTLCYLSDDELFAVLPYSTTSKRAPIIQWKRSGVPAGSEICADADYVILIPPQLNRLIVLRSADGEQLFERPLPQGRVERKRADWGRLFLVSRTEPGDASHPERKTWAMYDPVTDKETWSLTLPKDTLWAPANGSDLTFLEPDGTLRLIDDQTGQPIWTSALPAQTMAPAEFTIHTDEDRHYLHTWHSPAPGQDPITEELSSKSGGATLVNGLAIALNRRTGSVEWSRPMEQQLYRAHVPAGSGLLAYVAQRRRESTQSVKSIYTSLVFLNRRTGEPVLIQETPGSQTGEGWTRLPRDAMLLRVCGQDFRLTWKDDPE